MIEYLYGQVSTELGNEKNSQETWMFLASMMVCAALLAVFAHLMV